MMVKKQVSDKKTEERRILEYFSRVYDDFPAGKIMESESPDFILSPEPKLRIGIEITSLTQGKIDNQKFHPAHINNHENEIIQQALKIYKGLNDSVSLFLSVSFKNDNKLNDKEIHKTALDLAEDVKNNVHNHDPNSSFSFTIEEAIASRYIEFIEGVHFPGMNYSTWINAGGYQASGFDREYLVQKILSKEQKLPLYRRSNLNFIWLILVTGSLQRAAPYNVHNQLEAWNVDSEFDRVFLFPVVENKVYEVQ